MRISITDRLVRNRIPEGSQATFTANFYDDSSDTWVLSAPTTAKYRVDNPETCETITDWTTLTPATSISIALNGSTSVLRDQSKLEEPRRLTVKANDGLATQMMQVRDWWVVNAFGVS